MHITKTKDRERIRRIALTSQGLIGQAPFGQGLRGAGAAIQHLGYVQLDSISVIERAHNHVWRSRVPNFKAEQSNQLLEKKEVFEYWAHAAAYLPMAEYRYYLADKAAVRAGTLRKGYPKDRKLMAKVLRRICDEGPLGSKDLEDRRTKSNGWWDWKPAKKAIEALYLEGELMIASRAGFQKTYDLTERVLPKSTNTTLPSLEARAAHMLDEQLRCHGLVSTVGATYGRKDAQLRRAMKAELDQRLAQGRLTTVTLRNGSVYYLEPYQLDQPMPRMDNQLKILSPFDNAVIQRKRLIDLFDFDYQLECYVPAPKRIFGYLALPLLYQGRFVGRMDCKAHRSDKILQLKGVFFEDDCATPAVCAALAAALPNFAAFQNCTTVQVQEVMPTKLKADLIKSLKH
ncbi:MAG: winged helix-turn-helix domain-containing protein [Proteobacteria bacterium]|nr:winged helix-turn-helix domain-containing protein [Pseudomonadota bacterium]